MQHDAHAMHGHPYRRLALMSALMFAAMYALMYAMVDRWGNVYNSLNQLWMALLMTAAMLVIELVVMRKMYPGRGRNAAILVVTVVALVGSWFAIRQQAAIGDDQFLRSMIPHHAGAVLMCEQAPVTNPEIVALCGDIVASPRREIARMKAILARDGR